MLAFGLIYATPVCPPVAGDDKPSPAEGTPWDKTYGTYGIPRGQTFRDRASGKLISIKVRSGLCVNSVQCTWSGSDKPVTGEIHGREEGQAAVVELDEGEYLTKVSGSLIPGDANITFVSGLTLKTNKRTLGPYGGAVDVNEFAIEAPGGEEICGFQGYSSGTEGLHAIGIIVRPRRPPVPGDDKPRPPEGSPTGKIYGGHGGGTFRDRAAGTLISIKVRAGSYLDSIQCTWSGSDKPVTGDVHGGNGGEAGVETVIRFEEGEYLTKVWGNVGSTTDNVPIVGSMTLKTNRRKFGPFGTSIDGEKFLIEAPRGEEICGFRGWSGWYVDAIGVVVRPIPKP